jgi:acetyl-CoA acyltransferase
LTAEKVAQRWQVDRASQDTFAFESHCRALKAIAQNEFISEITPYQIQSHAPDLLRRTVSLHKNIASQDEGPRTNISLDALAKLAAIFAKNGSVTAGNSSQMSDGAGAILLVSEKALTRYNLTPMGKFLGFAVAGVPPEIMGIGPKKAIPLVLQQTGLQLDDIDWIELNEAFAAQTIAVIREVKLDPTKVNPLGGAIALGHPLGATGVIRTATMLHGLRRHRKKYGMVTMCIGTGMGAAGIFEAT